MEFRRGQTKTSAADDGVETMSFDVTEEDWADAMGSHVGFGLKPRGRQNTKEWTTYGIWAADEADSDEDGGTSVTQSKMQKSRNNFDYSAPINFVSSTSASKQSDDVPTSHMDVLKSTYSSSDSDAGSGDDVSKSSRSSKAIAGSARRFANSGNRVTSWASKFQSSATPDNPLSALETSGQISGLRTVCHSRQSVGTGMGDWEKHTRGIGAKLLLQMGYEAGKGLGRDLQGRSSIVEAKLRKGRGAVGAYGSEKVASERKASPDSEAEEEEQFQSELRQWRHKDGKKMRKVRYVYKTADEVIEEERQREDSDHSSTRPAFSAAPSGSAFSNVKVLDMRGPEQRVLSGYHAISAKTAHYDTVVNDDAHFALPELMSNIHKMLDATEQEIINADRQLREHAALIESLSLEKETIGKRTEQERHEVTTLQSMLSDVEMIEAMHQEGRLDLGGAADLFHRLKGETCSNDDNDIWTVSDWPRSRAFDKYQVYHIAHTVVVPLVIEAIKDWQPLSQPFNFADLFVKWKALLELPTSPKPFDVTKKYDEATMCRLDPYYDLVDKAWLPIVRRSLTSDWSVRKPDMAIDLLKIWTPLLPVPVVVLLRDVVIIPKIKTEVDQWDPSRDSVPIHHWIHPWLDQVFGNDDHLLRPMYPVIRSKLASALTRWHPSDKSARLILTPWHPLFVADGSFTTFVTRHICPRLEACLSDAMSEQDKSSVIVPDAWRWLADWRDLFSVQVTVHMLQRAFFPAWLRKLALRLNSLHSAADYTGVVQWYSAWKEAFHRLPSGCLEQPQVATCLQQALQMMNRASQGGPPIPVPPAVKCAPVHNESDDDDNNELPDLSGGIYQIPLPKTKTAAQKAALALAASTPTSFRDILFKRCAEADFMIQVVDSSSSMSSYPGASGRQVYKVVSMSRLPPISRLVYIDRDVIFVKSAGLDKWLPVDLDELLSV